MIFTRILCTGLLSGVASVGFACNLPPLVAIPAKADIGDKAAAVQAEVATYIEGMRAYTACVQAELAAAGGDKAQPIVKAVLVQRNNIAVAEGQAVVKLFNDHVGAAAAMPAAGAPPAGAPPPGAPAGEESSRGRRNRDN